MTLRRGPPRRNTYPFRNGRDGGRTASVLAGHRLMAVAGNLPTDSASLADFLEERGEGAFRHEFKEGGEENEVTFQGFVVRFVAEYDENGVAVITTLPGTIVPEGLSARWDGVTWEPI